MHFANPTVLAVARPPRHAPRARGSVTSLSNCNGAKLAVSLTRSIGRLYLRDLKTAS